ncbi:dipeptidase [Paenibacillus amylolyticus]|uniref:Zinc-dependent dipeptidase, microsomal dipeptidase n=1 Tax=Paenibacillus amylolyticus TaxID=1451 RepID=A0A100VPN0_PAEAM|nr:dipeptidase [Paenibacillus amylolyticus]GAS83725.1 zinc-dependent dipeptidase, microsomal dipeptidase [Paenibacillus amylolyticus]
MHIIDLHCDSLFRIWLAKGQLSFHDAPELETSKQRLIEGGVKVQGFAVFVPPNLNDTEKFQSALDQIHYFYEEVLEKNQDIKHITRWSDIEQLQEHEIGAFLTLEGVDPIGNDLHKLSILYRLGVRSVGLTWNYANLAADGALEPRGAGLSAFGCNIIEFNNKHKILTDVSHLNERGFWDTLDIADYLIASHSNAKAVYDHPRSLSDEQAKALFAKDATIHVVYFPEFIKSAAEGNATIADLIKHIDHFCSLGGVSNIGLGSDFDGITSHVEQLEHAAQSQNLINELLKQYSEEQVRGFAYNNFLRRVNSL